MKSRKLIGIVTGFCALFALAEVASANQYYISPQASTATATSTVNYMTPGAATTTVTYDSYNKNGTNQPATTTQTDIPDRATLLIQFAGSSTAAVLNINLEYSQDNIDWYSNDLGQIDGFTVASTTNGALTANISNPQSFTWTFASSTIGGIAATATGATSTKAIGIPVPTRYTRAVLSCGAGGTNCAVWATFIPKKQFPTK